MDAVGHINACVGLAQALAKRGHSIYFLTNPSFAGTFEKSGFNEIILIGDENHQTIIAAKMKAKQEATHPLEAIAARLERIRKTNWLSEKSSYEKILEFNPNEPHDFLLERYEELRAVHPQIEAAIKQELPDLIIIDRFFIPPCIAYGTIPWASLFSGNPLHLYDSPDVPPRSSGKMNIDSTNRISTLILFLDKGYPSNDRTGWEEFRKKHREGFPTEIRYHQNNLNREFGYPKTSEDEILRISPYMNIYGYPEELDYRDIAQLPDNYIRMDTFCLETSEQFELPKEFRSKLLPNDKLVYVSLGSMASIDVDLMKRIVAELSNSPHKFIVSMGVAHSQYQLSDNMWGKPYLVQTKILPLVDLVITHGGNNTVTEAFYHGKPMLVMPLFADQYDNAQRILEKGYGNRFNGYLFKQGELCAMIDRILNDQQMIQRCKKAGERMRSANSKQKACEKIEEIVERLSFKN